MSSVKAVLRVGLSTVGVLAVWVAAVFFGTSEGWWKQPIAPRGDSAAFMGAAKRTIEGGQGGNTVMAVIRDGTLQGVHAASIGAAVNADTVFQTASLSKWLTAWGVMALVEQGKLDLDAPGEPLPETLDLALQRVRQQQGHRPAVAEPHGRPD